MAETKYGKYIIDRPIWYLATGPTKIYKKEIKENDNNK